MPPLYHCCFLPLYYTSSVRFYGVFVKVKRLQRILLSIQGKVKYIKTCSLFQQNHCKQVLPFLKLEGDSLSSSSECHCDSLIT